MGQQLANAEINNKKVTNAWCFYDWSNSVFPLTITSAIFPIYWDSQTKAGIAVGNFVIEGSVMFSYCLSFAFLIIAIINPILSGIADYSGNKKSFMKAFVYIGVLGCFGLFFFDKNHIAIGAFSFILGTIGYAGSIVFYNAYLPEIATEDRFDKLSAKGFSMGYIGGVILLIINLLFILFPQIIFNIDEKTIAIVAEQNLPILEAKKLAISFYEGAASRLAFVTVGVWWLGFSLIPFYYLPKNKITGHPISFKKGYQELVNVFKKIKQHFLMQRFLAAFFFYSMGVQTVMYVASMFGVKELKLPKENLIITILIIQLIAIAGAYFFSFLSKKIGNIKALMYSIIVWIGICIGAYFVDSVNGFYLLASVVGMVMGGIQSLSRSTFAKLIPNDSEGNTSYFSFYEFTEKIAIVIGTFSFGLIEQMIEFFFDIKSMRFSVLSLMVFFIIGFIYLFKIRKANVNV